MAFGFFFIVFSATGERVGFRAGLGFFVLGFHQTRGKVGQFLIAQAGRAVALCFGVVLLFVRFVVMLFEMRFRACGHLFRGLRGRFFGMPFARSCAFGCIVGKHPVREAAGEAARHAGSGRQAYRRAALLLLIVWLALLGFVVSQWFHRSLNWTRAIFRERFARENDVVFALVQGRCRAAIVRAAAVKAA